MIHLLGVEIFLCALKIFKISSLRVGIYATAFPSVLFGFGFALFFASLSLCIPVLCWSFFVCCLSYALQLSKCFFFSFAPVEGQI